MILCVLGSACDTTKGTTGRNLTALFAEPGENNIRVTYDVNHLQDGRTRVKWELDPNSLELDESMGTTMSLVFRYQIFYNYSTLTAVDSGSIILKEIACKKDRKALGEFYLNIVKDRNHLLEVTLRDLNSLRNDQQYIDIVKANRFSEQSYLMFDSDGIEITADFVTKADSYFIEPFVQVDKLWMRFYSRDFPTASPPFAIVNPKPFDFNPDRKVRLKANENGQFKAIIDKEGFYQFITDSASQSGGTVYFFADHYPEAKTVNGLMMPLRYITTTQEFEELTQSQNLKKSVDAYWLKIGGNPDRARMLIQSYYSRVERANQLFSSYLEGWKSDRGMCYIVFGPPTKVVRSTSAETWYYGEAGKYNTLTLTFTKVTNPFSNNDFRLNRNGSLKSPWYRAVEFWRQGRVITYQ
ncbi:MAG: GWxTD domain-containing protein [Flavobacteriales bacterium]